MLYTSGYAAVRCSGNYYIAELSDTSADGGWDHDRLFRYQDRLSESCVSQSGRDDTDCGNLGSDDSDGKNTTGALLWNGIYGRNDQCST